MIKISNTIPVRSYTSPTVSHPVKTGTGYNNYYINHNFGVIPDLIRILEPTDGYVAHRAWFDLDVNGSTNRGYWVHTSNINTTNVRCYRFDGASRDIYFIAFSFGTTAHNAT